MIFLSRLQLAEARHGYYFYGVGDVDLVSSFQVKLFCDTVLSDKT